MPIKDAAGEVLKPDHAVVPDGSFTPDVGHQFLICAKCGKRYEDCLDQSSERLAVRLKKALR